MDASAFESASADFRDRMATYVGNNVTASSMRLQMAPGSVIVSLVVVCVDASSASSVHILLAGSSASQLSLALGLPVASASAPSLSSLLIDAPSPPPRPPSTTSPPPPGGGERASESPPASLSSPTPAPPGLPLADQIVAAQEAANPLTRPFLGTWPLPTWGVISIGGALGLVLFCIGMLFLCKWRQAHTVRRPRRLKEDFPSMSHMQMGAVSNARGSQLELGRGSKHSAASIRGSPREMSARAAKADPLGAVLTKSSKEVGPPSTTSSNRSGLQDRRMDPRFGSGAMHSSHL